MPLNEQFIPGHWIDTIDVNDFVNLNKKPFLKEPLFLKNTRNSFVQEKFENIKNLFENNNGEVELDFSTLENSDFKWFNFEFDESSLNSKIGFSENITHVKQYYGISNRNMRSENRKTTYELFDEIAISEMKKMIKMNLISHAPTTYTPSFASPDVRIVSLYGTKQLIKEKRWELKALEKRLQTHEWMQRRISINREIDAIKQFEKFCSKNGFNVSNPAENATEAIDYILLSIAACLFENPSIPFSLSHVIPFLDIYFEHDIESGKLKEDEVQDLIELFYLRLSFIRFTLSPGLIEKFDELPIFFGETFGGEYITKTTYRFLYSLKKYNLFPFSIRIIWNQHLPNAFKEFIHSLVQDGIPISVFNGDVFTNKKKSFYSTGQNGDVGEELMFDSGACDLMKLFYLSLNGGKDIETNTNLTPITQPIRKKNVDFDEIINKFQDYLSFVLNSYIELMNIVMYLNDIHNQHPLRFSLMNFQKHYKVQFGFFNLDELVTLISAVYEDSFQIKINNKGWVEEIIPESDEFFSKDTVLSRIVSLIEEEISKIPIYKNGKAKTRMYHKDVFRVENKSEHYKKMVLPNELVKSSFHSNIHLQEGDSAIDIIEDSFQNGFTELNFSISNELMNINGIMFKKCNK